MNIKEKFGQMLMIGLDIEDINNEIIKLIKEYKIGGVVLYKKNYSNINEMLTFINKLKEINKDNTPLFISIDQENGRVNRFPSDIERIYNPGKQVSTKKMDIINECNKITCNLLKTVGVNMNYAPVVDINYDDSKIVGNRGYGNSKEEVMEYSFPLIYESKRNNIIPVIKHFPGHGLVNSDTHYLIPCINDIKKMNEDLIIYEQAINNDCDAIMVGHLRIKGYGKYPASINKEIINDLLLNKFNYKGLVLTDDLRMNTMKYIYGLKKIIIKTIDAGSNILMIKYKKGDTVKLYKDLYNLIDNKKINIDNINSSYDKIITIKNKYNISNNIISNKINIDKINKKIKEINILINN